MRAFYYDSGINWTWYLDATINPDHTATIHNHFRLHDTRDDNHPSAGLSFRFRETDKRIVTGVYLGSEYYVVTNPKHIFGYDEKV